MPWTVRAATFNAGDERFRWGSGAAPAARPAAPAGADGRAADLPGGGCGHRRDTLPLVRSTERLALHRSHVGPGSEAGGSEARSAACAKTSRGRCPSESAASTKRARCAPRSPGAMKNPRRRRPRRRRGARRATRCAGGRRTAMTSSPTCSCSTPNARRGATSRSPRARAATSRRRAASRLHPPLARNLSWLNPDGALQADVFFARGPRVYRIADAPAGGSPAGGPHARRPRSRVRDDRRARVPAPVRALRIRARRCAGLMRRRFVALVSLAALAARGLRQVEPRRHDRRLDARRDGRESARARAGAEAEAEAAFRARPEGAGVTAGARSADPHPRARRRVRARGPAHERRRARGARCAAHRRPRRRVNAKRRGAAGRRRRPSAARARRSCSAGAAWNAKRISSSVAVLHDARSVERDLAYAQTAAGLKCYRARADPQPARRSRPQHQAARSGRRAASGLGRRRGPRRRHQDPRARRRAGGGRRREAVRRRAHAAVRAGRDRSLRDELRAAGARRGPSRSCLRCCTSARLRRSSSRLRASGGCAARRGRPCPRGASPGRRPACPSAPSPRGRRSPRSGRRARRRG